MLLATTMFIYPEYMLSWGFLQHGIITSYNCYSMTLSIVIFSDNWIQCFTNLMHFLGWEWRVDGRGWEDVREICGSLLLTDNVSAVREELIGSSYTLKNIQKKSLTLLSRFLQKKFSSGILYCYWFSWGSDALRFNDFDFLWLLDLT